MPPVDGVDPGKTFAIVVGIERYAENDRQFADLNGPVNDAADFVEWLRDRDVPAGNIIALIAPAKSRQDESREARITQRFTSRGIVPEPATRTAIRSAFVERFAGKAGDLLVVHWSGHGGLAEGRDRRLFYAEATAKDPLNLSFDSLQRRLTSEAYGGFGKQLVVVDTCANHLEDVLRPTTMEPERLPYDPGIADVTQWMLFAAAEGEEALTLQYRGAFSAALLKLLREQATFPGDFDALGPRLQAELTAVRGPERQRPAFYTWKAGGAAEQVRGDIPRRAQPRVSRRRALMPDQADALAKYLETLPSMRTAAKREELVEELPRRLRDALTAPFGEAADLGRFSTNLVATALARDATNTVLETIERADGAELVEPLRRNARTLVEANEARNAVDGTRVGSALVLQECLRFANDASKIPAKRGLDEWIEALADMPPRGEVTRLAMFVMRLNELNHSDELQRWIDSHLISNMLREDVARAIAAAMPATRPYLAIELGVGARERKPGAASDIRAWLCDGAALLDPLHEPCAGDEASVKAAVGRLIDRARARCGFDFTVEFLLPREQLHVAPEHWPIPGDGISPESTVGADHSVVLRWRERPYLSKYRLAWKQRYKAILERVRYAPPDSWWIDDPTLGFSAVLKAVVKNPGGDVMSLGFVPSETPCGDVLTAALAGGAPFICFPHRPHADWTVAQEQIDLLVRTGLNRVREGFTTEDAPELRASYSVLWDDPGHEPLPEQLTQPE